MKEKVQYWVDVAEYDLETAKVMLGGKRFLYVGFMCHQVIEKILKGYYVFKKGENPPYTHNLGYLATMSGIYSSMTEEQKKTMDSLEPLHIEARYPTYKERLLKILNEKRCVNMIDETEELYQWISGQLSIG